MSNYGGKTGAKKKKDEIDEVEQLLRATEDEMLLKLTVDSHRSHTSSSSSSPLDQNLLRRFEALKLPSASNKITTVPPGSTQLGNDVSARFSSLKAGSGCGSSSTMESQVCSARSDGEDDEEDEVSKVIQWAKDAARLDPSLESDVEDGENDDDDDTDSEEDEQEEEEDEKKKKTKPPSGKNTLNLRGFVKNWGKR